MDPTIEFELMGIATAFKRYRLSVPPNQREYSWTEDEVSDLLRDIQSAMRKPNDPYFLGTIVLTKTGHDSREVADGQQRLATTMMILAAIRTWCEKNQDSITVESIDNEFLAKIDRDAGERIPRLTLNTDDNEYFRTVILPHIGKVKPIKQNVRRSHKLISGAKNIIRDYFEKLEQQHGAKDFREIVKEWINYLESQTQVVVLSVSDAKKCFTMFETLNSRGLATSQADLVKNYLFREAAERLPEAQSAWSSMRGAIESLGDEDLTMDYLRIACCVQCGPTREKDVMDRVEQLAKNKTESIRLVSLLGSMAADYAAIINPDHSKWNDYGEEVRRSISVINYLGVTQIRPLMLSVARHFKKPAAKRAFRNMVAWSVRFLIVGGRGGKLDEGYANLSNKIYKSEVTDDRGLQTQSANFVPTDNQFRGAFLDARVSVSKLARYYLRCLEMQANGQPFPEFMPFDDFVTNLEHVMPESPAISWSEQDVETHSKRIGNLALLKASDNSVVGNEPFSVKRKVYQNCSFSLTKQISTESKWGTQEIESRQKLLADLAVKTWPIA